MNVSFLKYRKIYFILSGILVLGGLICLGIFGLKPGIDFTGGSILEIKYEGERPVIETVRGVLGDIVGPVFIQSIDDNGLLIRMREIDEETGEIDAPQKQPQRRHQDVVDERGHDLAEGGADDEADRKVDDVAAHREITEFLEHGAFLPLTATG